EGGAVPRDDDLLTPGPDRSAEVRRLYPRRGRVRGGQDGSLVGAPGSLVAARDRVAGGVVGDRDSTSSVFQFRVGGRMQQQRDLDGLAPGRHLPPSVRHRVAGSPAETVELTEPLDAAVDLE